MNRSKLRDIIQQQLAPLIDSDYVFLEIPFYPNPGDIAIWKGTRDFLAELPHKCLYTASLRSCELPEISSNTIILLQGGGNFGDLYSLNQDFRNRIIQCYPDNRIIILPQTVHYNSARSLRRDVQIMRAHKHLTICARDRKSYQFLRRYGFSRHILLVPDMAFYCSLDAWKEYIVSPIKESLLVQRGDAEFKRPHPGHHRTPSNSPYKVGGRSHLQLPLQRGRESRGLEFIYKATDCHDWEFIRLNDSITQTYEQYSSRLCPATYEAYNDFLINEYYPHALQSAISQLSSYKQIYSTRLHAAIISFMLGKDVVLLDNSYGKNSAFYETWWKDEPMIHFEKDGTSVNFKRLLRMVLAYIWVQWDAHKGE